MYIPTKVVIFQNPDNTIAVLFPTSDKIDLKKEADKVVAKGKPYFIVNASDLPDINVYPQETWQVDFTNAPLSNGVTSNGNGV